MIRAVIGVWHEEDSSKAYYVRRSAKMANYPEVWSLLSEQFSEAEVADHLDLASIQSVFDRLAQKRLGKTQIRVIDYITSGTCADNPMNERVVLHLYRVELLAEPTLSPDYYTAAAWLSADDYLARAEEAACGLCTRLWSDHCVRMGWAEKPFAPPGPSYEDV